MVVEGMEGDSLDATLCSPCQYLTNPNALNNFSLRVLRMLLTRRSSALVGLTVMEAIGHSFRREVFRLFRFRISRAGIEHSLPYPSMSEPYYPPT